MEFLSVWLKYWVFFVVFYQVVKGDKVLRSYVIESITHLYTEMLVPIWCFQYHCKMASLQNRTAQLYNHINSIYFHPLKNDVLFVIKKRQQNILKETRKWGVIQKLVILNVQKTLATLPPAPRVKPQDLLTLIIRNKELNCQIVS